MSDLRKPIGFFFVLIGLALFAVPFAQAPLTTAPVNLYAGLSMVAFGGVMLWLAWRKR
jgi:nicotinamide riboside transporter PnuC